MTNTTSTTANKRKRNDKFDKLIGVTDPKIDYEARERIITARIGLLLKQPFFGNLATRMKLTNADDWLSTAAVDGVHLFYNSRFVMMLKQKEVEFLIAHEVLHLAYEHLFRRDNRDPQLWNVANDYAVNGDLKRQNTGQFITTVPCLFDSKYDGKSSEEIYDDLMKNVQKININDLLDKMLDEHMDGDDADGDEDGEDADGDKPGKGKRPKMSAEERERVRQEMKQAIINAAQSAEAGTLPAGIQRMIKQLTEHVMPWRELIQCVLTSSIRSDYTWMRPSRRSWHMDAVMPGMNPGEEIDVDIYIDLSGSISNQQGMAFLSEVAGMMEEFDGYSLRVTCFDTRCYNTQEFTSENMENIEEYELKGGGGTDFDCVFDDLKAANRVPNKLIVFTDGYPCGSWGDANYCDTVWIIHGDKNPNPPFGTWALYDDHRK